MAMKSDIRRIEIEPAEAGHIVTHYYKEHPTHSSKMGMAMAYHEPERHVFSRKDGHDMIAHVANALKIPAAAEEMAEEKERD